MRRSAALAIGLALAAGPGCVRAYQPLSGLNGPVVVDPTLPNFEDVHLDVHCVPGDALTRPEASILCRKLQVLFENQGASVVTHASEGETEAPEQVPDRPVRLSVELRARDLHESRHAVSWALCIVTFTLLPGVLETAFAQDVVIRDDSGFLLVTDTLEGRLVERFGLGTWAGNALLDLTLRDDDEKVTGEAAERALSSDLYRQLSQLVFNARMHARVMGG